MTTPDKPVARLLRWREVEPLNGSDKTFLVGDSGHDDLDGLLAIEHHGRVRDAGPYTGWRCVARYERDGSFPDGWYWRPLMLPDGGPDAREMTTYSAKRDIEQDVANNWELLEAQARGWLVHATVSPVAAQEAVEEERDRQAAEALGLQTDPGDMLRTVAAVTPPETEARDARVSPDMQAALERRYAEYVEIVVTRLRRTADRIEERQVRQSIRDLRLDFGNHAASVLDEIASLIGNAGLGALTEAARDADLAVRGRMP